jgi:hypothetical protein
MIRVHTPTRAAMSPILISPERYTLLHAVHSLLNHTTDFTQDLLKLMTRYHPRAKSLKPQGRKKEWPTTRISPPHFGKRSKARS